MEQQPSITKSDIDTLVSRIADNEDMADYLIESIDRLKEKLKLNQLIARFNSSGVLYCEECEYEESCAKCGTKIVNEYEIGCPCVDTTTMFIDCSNCGGLYYYFFKNLKTNVAEIFKIFTKNFKCKLNETFEYNDGCKYLVEYTYTITIDDNITLCYDFKPRFLRDPKHFITNKLTNTTYDLEKRSFKYPDCYTKLSMLCDDCDWDVSDLAYGLDENIEPNLFNTTEVWKYIIEKYPDIPHEKIALLLLEFVYLLMDTFTEQPAYD